MPLLLVGLLGLLVINPQNRKAVHENALSTKNEYVDTFYDAPFNDPNIGFDVKVLRDAGDGPIGGR